MSRFTYTADRSGAILSFGPGEWGASRSATSILECISNETLKALWLSLIHKALEVGSLQVECACDDAQTRRRIRIDVVRTGEFAVEITSTLLEEIVRPPEVAAQLGSLLPLMTVCSWCNRVRGVRDWIAPEVALSEGEHERSPGGATHGICPECLAELLKAAG